MFDSLFIVSECLGKICLEVTSFSTTHQNKRLVQVWNDLISFVFLYSSLWLQLRNLEKWKLHRFFQGSGSGIWESRVLQKLFWNITTNPTNRSQTVAPSDFPPELEAYCFMAAEWLFWLRLSPLSLNHQVANSLCNLIII